MRIKSSIEQDHNNLLIQLDGKQTFVAIMTNEGDILRVSRSQGIKEFSFSGESGRYQIESDGAVQSVRSRLLEIKNQVKITVLSYNPRASNVIWIALDDQLQEMTVDELLEKKIISLRALKIALVEYFSELTDRLRKEIISNDQLIYALIGVYSVTIKNQYKKTILAFENENKRLIRIIRRAKSLNTLKKLKANFPNKIIVNTKVVKKTKGKVVKKQPSKK